MCYPHLWLELEENLDNSNSLYVFQLILTLLVQCISESCIKITINLNFYFHILLWCLRNIRAFKSKIIFIPYWSAYHNLKNLLWVFIDLMQFSCISNRKPGKPGQILQTQITWLLTGKRNIVNKSVAGYI